MFSVAKQGDDGGKCIIPTARISRPGRELRHMGENSERIPPDAARPTLNSAALTVADVAPLLDVPVEMVEKDLAEGAPASADGSANLIQCAAWQNRDRGRLRRVVPSRMCASPASHTPCAPESRLTRRHSCAGLSQVSCGLGGGGEQFREGGGNSA